MEAVLGFRGQAGVFVFKNVPAFPVLVGLAAVASFGEYGVRLLSVVLSTESPVLLSLLCLNPVFCNSFLSYKICIN